MYDRSQNVATRVFVLSNRKNDFFLIRWGRSNGVNVMSKKQELAFKNINFVLSIRYPYGNVELTMYIFTCLVYGFFIYIIMPLWGKLIF